jgi:hypothetical protein
MVNHEFPATAVFELRPRNQPTHLAPAKPPPPAGRLLKSVFGRFSVLGGRGAFLTQVAWVTQGASKNKKKAPKKTGKGKGKNRPTDFPLPTSLVDMALPHVACGHGHTQLASGSSFTS